MQFHYKKITRVEYIKTLIGKLSGSRLNYQHSKNISYKKSPNSFSLSIGNATSPNTLNSYQKVSILKLLTNSNVYKSHKHGKSSHLFTE